MMVMMMMIMMTMMMIMKINSDIINKSRIKSKGCNKNVDIDRAVKDIAV